MGEEAARFGQGVVQRGFGGAGVEGHVEGKAAQRVVSDVPSRREMACTVVQKLAERLGAADIATGAPDSANGRFEVTGLGHEYLQTATLTPNAW